MMDIKNAKNTIGQKEGKKEARFDLLFWIIALALLVIGLAAYYYYAAIPWAIRAAAGLVLLCVIAGVILQTSQGHKIWQFSKEARAELRKVVWPTRQETVQTTVVVIIMVVVVALILWGIDSILMWLIRFITG